MRINSLSLGPVGANCYFVFNDESHCVFIIDPGAEPDRVIKFMEGYQLEAIFLTHGHFDHIGAVDEIEKVYPVPVYIHEADEQKLTDEHLNASAHFAYHVTVQTKPELLRDGDCIQVCGARLTVMNTPGHSRGSCCFLLNDNEAIFTGDTLFSDGYGRTDFEDGSFSEIRASLKKLFFLTPRRIAYPGHGASCYIGKSL